MAVLATAGLRCWAVACILLTATAGCELYGGAILGGVVDEARRDKWRADREEAVTVRPELVVDSEAARVARRRMAGEGGGGGEEDE